MLREGKKLFWVKLTFRFFFVEGEGRKGMRPIFALILLPSRLWEANYASRGKSLFQFWNSLETKLFAYRLFFFFFEKRTEAGVNLYEFQDKIQKLGRVGFFKA